MHEEEKETPQEKTRNFTGAATGDGTACVAARTENHGARLHAAIGAGVTRNRSRPAQTCAGGRTDTGTSSSGPGFRKHGAAAPASPGERGAAKICEKSTASFSICSRSLMRIKNRPRARRWNTGFKRVRRTDVDLRVPRLLLLCLSQVRRFRFGGGRARLCRAMEI